MEKLELIKHRLKALGETGLLILEEFNLASSHENNLEANLLEIANSHLGSTWMRRFNESINKQHVLWDYTENCMGIEILTEHWKETGICNATYEEKKLSKTRFELAGTYANIMIANLLNNDNAKEHNLNRYEAISEDINSQLSLINNTNT